MSTKGSRRNLKYERNVNRFIIFTVEQYAKHINKNSSTTYALLKEYGILDELKDDYEDLHGFSVEYLNYYFDGIIRNNKKEKID